MRFPTLLLLAFPAVALAQAPVPTTPAKPAADKMDKIVCKSTPEIGSLIATTKICKTRREWTRDNDNLRERGPVGNCAGGSQGGSC